MLTFTMNVNQFLILPLLVEYNILKIKIENSIARFENEHTKSNTKCQHLETPQFS
jgi:hypothetical protein